MTKARQAMKKSWRMALLLGITGLLPAACGQTGALYLPDSGGEESAAVAPQGNGVALQGNGVTPQRNGVTPQRNGVTPQNIATD